MRNIIKKVVSKVLYDFADKDTEEKIRYRFSRKYRERLDSRLHAYETNLKLIESEPKQEPIVIVFICQVPALWNNVESIYEAAVKDKRVKPYIVAIPEKEMAENYDISAENYGKNEAYQFCKHLYGDTVINGFNEEDHTFFDLRSLNPIYVCLPRPYDMHVPPEYRSTEISKYAKLFFLPYGYDMCKWDVKLLYETEFLASVYAIFCENSYGKEVVRNTFSNVSPVNTKRIKDLGYPAFDRYKGIHHSFDSHFKATVLWMPRWTTNKAVEATTFFKYKDGLIKYFINHPEYKLIFRPHPLMLRNYISCHLMTEKEVSELLDYFREFPNLVYDNDGDYTNSILNANIIISDYSSLLIHSLLVEVPVIYTGRTSNFNRYMKKIEKGMYIVRDQEELFATLENLLAGNDSLKQEHEKIRRLLVDDEYQAGKRILEYLITDYERIGKDTNR